MNKNFTTTDLNDHPADRRVRHAHRAAHRRSRANDCAYNRADLALPLRPRHTTHIH